MIPSLLHVFELTHRFTFQNPSYIISIMIPRARKTIFHIDVNAAFLSWSAVKRLKEAPGSVDLRTIPSAVAGDIEERRGVITAKSIPAKKYGVETGEPVVKALAKCPELVIVKSDFETYRRYSASLMKILKTYSPTVEQASIDEAYMDMTGTEAIFEAEGDDEPFPMNAATRIKNEIRNTLGFTVNIGISSNKLLAKMASDFEKPDRIHTLYPEEIGEKLWPLPIARLYGCGEATAAKLNALDVRTIGDAAHMDESILRAHLGERAGRYIYHSANGMDDSAVSGAREETKGYSHETTLPKDVTAENYEPEVPRIVHAISEKLSERLKADGVFASTVVIQIKTDRFVRHSRQMQLPDSTNSAEKIEEIATLLLKRLLFGEQGMFSRNVKIRLIGVSVTKLDRGEFRQMSMFDFMKPAKRARRMQGTP